jgi:hypothetical protein
MMEGSNLAPRLMEHVFNSVVDLIGILRRNLCSGFHPGVMILPLGGGMVAGSTVFGCNADLMGS